MDWNRIAIGNDKQVVGDAGDGFVVVVSDDNAVILGLFPNKLLDCFNVHGINLRERLVQDIERSFTQEHQA